jgi:hypothetical protein
LNIVTILNKALRQTVFNDLQEFGAKNSRPALLLPAAGLLQHNNILYSVLNKNLENLAFFAPFGRPSNWAAGAAVAVGMGKPAFCAGFQAPRRGVGTRHESTINPPSERHFHSKTLDFKGFGKIL